MWVCLNDAFLSIVKKDCPPDHFLVRARRPGDIEKVFGRRIKVERLTDADYLFRARIPREDVEAALVRELGRVTYPNFKDSVKDHDLHSAYHRVWFAMAKTQNPPPYSERRPRLNFGPSENPHFPFLDGTMKDLVSDLKRPVSRPKKGPKK